MILNPKPGQTVRIHYNKRICGFMPHHGKVGRVVLVGKSKPRNHLIDVDGEQVVIP